MLRKLSTSKFRGLRDFTMGDLGRINLIVGANNCGKTSVLEALQLLVRTGDPWVLWSSLARRGEDLFAPRGGRGRVMDVSHFFEGHEFDLGSTFTIEGLEDKGPITFKASIIPAASSSMTSSTTDSPSQRTLFNDNDIMESPDGPVLRSGLTLEIQWNATGLVHLPLTQGGGWDIERTSAWRRARTSDRDISRPVELITTAALDDEETVAALEEVILTENEEVLIRALTSIEPDIERIAPIGNTRRYTDINRRSGVAVKLRGVKNRIPLGSMGDGMWRMLGIALCLVRAKGGILLIDEIDTGLHYAVMEKMWRLVYDTAKRLDVQVFAATHSRDCYQSLASVVQEQRGSKPEITIQRIERGNPRAVAFTDQEVTIAAESRIEVR